LVNYFSFFQANPIEAIQMNENRSKLTVPDVEINIDETTFAESPAPVIATIVRPISDPKLEKKVTFARLLSKVSAEMSSGSDVDLGNVNILYSHNYIDCKAFVSRKLEILFL
jgi:hypothetical protein